MQYTEIILETKDQHSLLVRHYDANADGATRSLVIVHGLCEHGQRYDRMARLMARNGWNVIVGDQRGHGRSEGIPAHVEDFDQYVQDIQEIVELFGCDPQRTAILGHSMGGLVAVRFAQTLQGRVAALVLLSPLLAVKVRIPWYLRVVALAFGRLFSAVMPHWRFRSPIDPAQTTRCPEVLEQKRGDRMLCRSVTVGWFMAMRAACRQAWSEAAKLHLPLLVMQAGQDEVVDPKAPQEWLAFVAGRDKTLRHVPHGLHELLSEPDWRDTAAYVAQWLEERVTASVHSTRHAFDRHYHDVGPYRSFEQPK